MDDQKTVLCLFKTKIGISRHFRGQVRILRDIKISGQETCEINKRTRHSNTVPCIAICR